MDVIVPQIHRVMFDKYDIYDKLDKWQAALDGDSAVNDPACFKQGIPSNVKVKFYHAKTLTFDTLVQLRADVHFLDEYITGEDYDRTDVTFESGTWDTEHAVNSEANAQAAIKDDYDVDMQWRYQVKSPNGTDEWISTGNSDNLRYYLVWDDPTAPQTKPWNGVLEKAVAWAEGKDSLVDAVTAITEEIKSCGKFKYDGPPPVPLGDGSSRYIDYTDNEFDLTQVLSDLGGASTVALNCSDTGHMVTTFANAFGCGLWSSRMGYHFLCNQVVVIGSSTWAEPFGGSGFSYHEVGWTGACGDSDKVYDPCLKVDGNGDPSAAPRTAELPADITFSDGSEGSPYVYRESLAAPGADGYGECLSRPTTKVRRPVK